MFHSVTVLLHRQFILMVFLGTFIQAACGFTHINTTCSVSLLQTLWVATGTVTLIEYVPLFTVLEFLIPLGCVNFIKKNVLKRTSANMKVFSIVKITQPSVLKFEVGNLHKFGPEGGIWKKYKSGHNFLSMHFWGNLSTLS